MTKVVAGFITLACLVAAPAAAQAPAVEMEDDGSFFAAPPFSAAGAALRDGPSDIEIRRVYPRGPLAAETPGYATLGCGVLPSGALSRCRVKAESPRGAGFGAAAASLVPLYHYRPQRADGGYVEFRVNFVPNLGRALDELY